MRTCAFFTVFTALCWTFDPACSSDIRVFRSIETTGTIDDESITNFVQTIIENFKTDMKTGSSEIGMPVLDPLQIPPVSMKVSDDNIKVSFVVEQLNIDGLSEFVIEDLDVSLTNLNFSLNLFIPHLVGRGQCFLEGIVYNILPLEGNGDCSVKGYNISLSLTASLTGDEHLQLGNDFNIDIDFLKVEIDFDTLLGGGNWIQEVLKFVGGMGRSVFHQFLPDIQQKLKEFLLKKVNKELISLPIGQITTGDSANHYVDQVIENVKVFMTKNNLDPMDLPGFENVYSKKSLGIVWKAELKLYDGKLKGLQSIKRAGDCDVTATEKEIEVTAHLGLKNLYVAYKGKSQVMGIGPKIECSGSIKSVAFLFTIEQSSEKGSSPRLKELEITDMSALWLDVDGLGPLTWFTKWMFNAAALALKKHIEARLTIRIKDVINKELQNINFPIG